MKLRKGTLYVTRRAAPSEGYRWLLIGDETSESSGDEWYQCLFMNIDGIIRQSEMSKTWLTTWWVRAGD